MVKRIAVLAAAAMAVGCAGSEGGQAAAPGADAAADAVVKHEGGTANMLGPNMLGPNMLGPNMLGPNMLGPNGLVPSGIAANGLGPNFARYLRSPGIAYKGTALDKDGVTRQVWVLTRGANAQFDVWFETFPGGPEAATQGMGYFVRCAYGDNVRLVYDGYISKVTGDYPQWVGQYGFASKSLEGGVFMSADDGKVVSACLLAHTNIKGTHQYISLRSAIGATSVVSAGELWTQRYYHGAFYGDLFRPEPVRKSCWTPNTPRESMPPPWYLEIVLGRTCDWFTCTAVNPSTGFSYNLVENNGWCGDPGGGIKRSSDVPTPLYTTPSWVAPSSALSSPTTTYENFFPVFLNGPLFAEAEQVPLAVTDAQNVPAVGAPAQVFNTSAAGAPAFDPRQMSMCEYQGCLRPLTGGYGSGDYGYKLINMSPGQAITSVVRYQARIPATGLETTMGAPVGPSAPDMNQKFTAIIRYSNPRGVNAAARISVSGAAGMRTIAGDELWTPTTASNGGKYQWMQIYPVQGYYDTEHSGGRPALKVKIEGVAQGESCTGAKYRKGDGEGGTCSYTGRVIPYSGWVCPKAYESSPACRGSLVLRSYLNPLTRVTTWYFVCEGGGRALYSCNNTDAPQIDSIAFVPSTPWCYSGSGEHARSCGPN